MGGDFQPRPFRPGEQLRADFIEMAKKIPQAEELSNTELEDVREALAGMDYDIIELAKKYDDESVFRGISSPIDGFESRGDDGEVIDERE